MYFETVKLSAQRQTVASSIRSAFGRRTEGARYRLISLNRGRGAGAESRLLEGAPAHRLLAPACRRCRFDDRLQACPTRLRFVPGPGRVGHPLRSAVAARLRSPERTTGEPGWPRHRRAVEPRSPAPLRTRRTSERDLRL